MPAQKISPIHSITTPLALRSAGDPEAFTEAAERNVQDMHDMSVSINDTLIPGINAIVEPVNSVLDNLQNIDSVATNIASVNTAAAAIDAIMSAPDAAASAHTAKADAQASAADATASKDAAAGSEAAASASATAAQSAETSAQAAAVAAAESKDAAALSVTAAAGSVTAAQAEVARAGTEADRSRTEADRAKTEADKATEIAAGNIPNASYAERGLIRIKENSGLVVSNGELEGVSIATTEKAGIVKPDGVNMTVDPVTGLVSVRGATVVSTPVIALGDNVPVGLTVKFAVAATSLLAPAQAVTLFTWSVAGLGIVDHTVDAANGNAEITLTIPADTVVGTQLTVTVVASDALGNASRTATAATTVSAYYVIPPEFVTPVEGATIQPTNVSWVMGQFKTLGVDDVHVASRYKILNDAGTDVYDSGEITDASGLTIWKAAAPAVIGGANRIQAAYKGADLGWSTFAEVNVNVAGIKKPRIISPAVKSSISHYYVTMGTSAFALDATGVADTHVASRYRIRSQDGQTVLYDSGEVADLVRHIVVGLDVPDRTVVQIDTMHKGKKLGWSVWGDTVSVTIVDVAQYENAVEYITAGNYNFTVPDDVTKLRVLVVGGGGRGGDFSDDYVINGGKGGGIISAYINVSPGSVIPLNVGAFSVDSTFGTYITAGGGTRTTRGMGTAHFLPAVGELICNLADTPCSTYKSCKSFKEMALNEWTYDRTYTSGSPSGDGNPGGSGSATTYGVGGNGGNGGVAGIGGSGGNGGYGGGKGGNGGNGGYGGSGGNGGDGSWGGNGANGSYGNTNGYGGSGGNGGNGGRWGGNGGNGGKGGDGSNGLWMGGKGGNGGYGGNGGDGGIGGYGGRWGGDGGNGGPGCVVIFF